MKGLVGLCAVGVMVGAIGCAADPGQPGWVTGDDQGTDNHGSKDGGTKADSGHIGAGQNDAGGVTPDATADSGTADSGNGDKDSGGTTTDSGGGTDGGGPIDSGTDTGVVSTLTPLAHGISISSIAMLQGVQVDVVKNGSKVATRNAPVVSGRDGLLRAYVTPDSTFSSHSLTAELRMTSGGHALPVVTDTKTISRASDDATLASTFNFDLQGANIATDTVFSISITDPALTSGASDGTAARYPQTGTDALGAKSSGDQLKVMVVPMLYAADGSNRAPATDAAQLEVYRKTMYGIYPAAKVVMSVHAPYTLSSAIDASGNGFDTALQELQNLRAQDNPADDLYYYGAFEPDSSFGNYCGSGCVVGLSGLAMQPSDAGVRASVGIGYSGTESAETMAHEVGHAHGRQHAPCGGAANPDTAFPYSGGGIGTWGYDLNAKTLMNPSNDKDLMGYCTPTWISDYNYAALFTRMAYVNNVPNMVGAFASPQPYRFINVRANGTVDWGTAITLRSRPFGEEHTVTYRAEDGTALGTAVGHYYAYDHLPGGYLLVPVMPNGASHVTIAGPRVTTFLMR